jgi:hypothetical protein
MSSLDDAIKRMNEPIDQVQLVTEKTPLLTCIITGKTRATTRQYLEQKARNLSGETVDERIKTMQDNYVCRDAVKLLKRGHSAAEVRAELGGAGKAITEDRNYIDFLLSINGGRQRKAA